MKDKEFLTWIHDRLIDKHGEDENVDFIHKLRSIIMATPENKETPNICITRKDMNLPIFNLGRSVDPLTSQCWDALVSASGVYRFLKETPYAHHLPGLESCIRDCLCAIEAIENQSKVEGS